MRPMWAVLRRGLKAVGAFSITVYGGGEVKELPMPVIRVSIGISTLPRHTSSSVLPPSHGVTTTTTTT